MDNLSELACHCEIVWLGGLGSSLVLTIMDYLVAAGSSGDGIFNHFIDY